MARNATKKIPRLGKAYFELAVDFLAHPEKYESLGPEERTMTQSDRFSSLADEGVLRPENGYFKRFTEIRGYCRKPQGETSESFELVVNGKAHTIKYEHYYNLVTLKEITATTELPVPDWVEPQWLEEPTPTKPAKKLKACGPAFVLHKPPEHAYPEEILRGKPHARTGHRQNWASANE